ncbi:lipopolysaccharide assembly protein LapA domain-containing protein [Zavarzinia sp.]|uniref:lipopolysaccharide assembly protein LapA domain-containing protein n=1 Tax=Zavarzinia sp. TaxID=2027920 RepID=UPI003563D757
MKLRTLLITLPIVIVLVALAVANRAPVRLSLDPFGGATSGYAVEMPLFLALFAALLLGVLIGGTVAWGAGLRRRRRLRISNVGLKRDLDRARADVAAAKPADAVAQLPAPQ